MGVVDVLVAEDECVWRLSGGKSEFGGKRRSEESDAKTTGLTIAMCVAAQLEAEWKCLDGREGRRK